MASLSATALPAHGWVRIRVALDVAARFRLWRVDNATAEQVPVRPHTAYDGWWQLPSGTGALMYDTEAPLDAPFHYHLETDEEPPVALDSTAVMLASNGGSWLRSPLLPYKDRRVVMMFNPSCPPAGEGVFFASMDSRESLASKSATVSPVNTRLGPSIGRPRGGWSSTLNLVTRTFPDRDRVVDTLSDGVALQWVCPPDYGIPPRYVAVGDVDVTRGMPDHRFPARLISMPFTQVRQPAGPAAGVAGARFRDLCQTYASWDAAATAGVTYDDMITVS